MIMQPPNTRVISFFAFDPVHLYRSKTLENGFSSSFKMADNSILFKKIKTDSLSQRVKRNSTTDSSFYFIALIFIQELSISSESIAVIGVHRNSTFRNATYHVVFSLSSKTRFSIYIRNFST